MSEYDVEALVQHYGLPPLPEADFSLDPEARILILFRRDDTNITLTEPVAFADANEYTNREDTSGEGWFVGRDKPNGTGPGEEY